jgi:uncharacterized protein (TIGR03435 family)
MLSPHRHICATLFLAAAAHAQSTFEVATIKTNTSATTSMKFPVRFSGRFNGTNLNLRTLISFAYGVQGFQIANGPSCLNCKWLNSDRYDIAAKASGTDVTPDQYREMLQALLVGRFHLTVHRETKEVPIYAITPAKSGGKLEESRPGSCVTPGSAPQPPDQPAQVVCGTFFTGPASLDVRKMLMTQIANTLAIILGRPVIDKTGFTGTYDFHLEFLPEGVAVAPGRQPGLEATSADDTRPAIYTALQQQLGLRLESLKGPSEVLVIDHFERVPVNN